MVYFWVDSIKNLPKNFNVTTKKSAKPDAELVIDYYIDRLSSTDRDRMLSRLELGSQTLSNRKREPLMWRAGELKIVKETIYNVFRLDCSLDELLQPHSKWLEQQEINTDA